MSGPAGSLPIAKPRAADGNVICRQSQIDRDNHVPRVYY